MHPILSFFFALICALLAKGKRRSGSLWFFLGFIFQYFALFVIIFMPPASAKNRSYNRNYRHYNSNSYYLNCPQCQRKVPISNPKAYGRYSCPHCQNQFVYGQESNRESYKNQQSNSSANSNGLSLSEAYEVLDCKEGDSFSEIKKSYREKAAKFHPDKIKGKDLAKEYEEFANQKFIEVRKAYEQLKEHYS